MVMADRPGARLPARRLRVLDALRILARHHRVTVGTVAKRSGQGDSSPRQPANRKRVVGTVPRPAAPAVQPLAPAGTDYFAASAASSASARARTASSVAYSASAMAAIAKSMVAAAWLLGVVGGALQTLHITLRLTLLQLLADRVHMVLPGSLYLVPGSGDVRLRPLPVHLQPLRALLGLVLCVGHRGGQLLAVLRDTCRHGPLRFLGLPRELVEGRPGRPRWRQAPGSSAASGLTWCIPSLTDVRRAMTGRAEVHTGESVGPGGSPPRHVSEPNAPAKD